MSLTDIAARYTAVLEAQEDLSRLQRELDVRTAKIAPDVVAHFDRFVQKTLLPLMSQGCSVTGSHSARYDAFLKGYVLQMGFLALPKDKVAVVLPLEALDTAVKDYRTRCSWVSRVQPYF